jgi:hypothetical protein
VVPTIQIRASQADTAKYQALLRSDWNKDTLDDVLALLWGLIAGPASPAHEWQQVLAFDTGKLAGKDLSPHILLSIRGLAQALAEPDLPPMPATFSTGRGTRSIAHAEKTWAYLMLQGLANLTGETGFFHDTQSLLFSVASTICCRNWRTRNWPPSTTVSSTPCTSIRSWPGAASPPTCSTCKAR